MNTTQSTIINAYGAWMKEEMDEKGYTGYLLTFMFHRLTGTNEMIIQAMWEAITAFYARAVTRVMRYPNSEHNRDCPMKCIAVPDRPVPKHARSSIRLVTLNGGVHAHALLLVPPFTRRQLKTPFDVHINAHQGLYAIDPLIRVHAQIIDNTPERVSDYAFKSLKRSHFGFDDVLILPRTMAEMK